MALQRGEEVFPKGGSGISTHTLYIFRVLDELTAEVYSVAKRLSEVMPACGVQGCYVILVFCSKHCNVCQHS